jgi:hypothetical protein
MPVEGYSERHNSVYRDFLAEGEMNTNILKINSAFPSSVVGWCQVSRPSDEFWQNFNKLGKGGL